MSIEFKSIKVIKALISKIQSFMNNEIGVNVEYDTLSDAVDGSISASQISYKNGQNDGYDQGYGDGYDAGYESGKAYGAKEEYDTFWDAYQNSGNRTNYSYAFAGSGWTDANYKPPYAISPIDAYKMFCGTSITDIVNCPADLDFSQTKDFGYMFYGSRVERIGTIDFRNSTEKTLDHVFYACGDLHTINEIILPDDDSMGFSLGSFSFCTMLKNLTIKGTIAKDLSIESSYLTKASITSVINALSPTTEGLRFSLSVQSVNGAFDGGKSSEEWQALIATKPNWTISTFVGGPS